MAQVQALSPPHLHTLANSDTIVGRIEHLQYLLGAASVGGLHAHAHAHMHTRVHAYAFYINCYTLSDYSSLFRCTVAVPVLQLRGRH